MPEVYDPTNVDESHNPSSPLQNKQPRKVSVCDVVMWHDGYGMPYAALVTAVWSQTCINVVVVSIDQSKDDTYGRQIERHTSVIHKSLTPVHGNYWRFCDEEPNPVVAPESK